MSDKKEIKNFNKNSKSGHKKQKSANKRINVLRNSRGGIRL